MSEEGKNCFVIMPFGLKHDADGNEIDFDRVYEDVIASAIESAGYVPIRADQIESPGSIQRDMFVHIARDNAAVVDLSTLNPNVFYELGVRHALRPTVTVLIKTRGSTVPFNIHNQRVIDYPSKSGSYDEAKEQIRRFLEAGRNATTPDSPIFSILQNARKDWKAQPI